MNDLSNTPIYDNGDLIGFKSSRVEGDFQIETVVDLAGNVTETKTAIYSTVALTDLSPAFQLAWAGVVSSLGTSFAGELDFEQDGDQITVLRSGSVLGFVTSWTSQAVWDDIRMSGVNPKDVEVTEETSGYQIFDANWDELASTGSSVRTISKVDGLTTSIVDERAAFTSYSVKRAGYTGDWDAMDPSVSSGIVWSTVDRVQVNSYSVDTVVDGNEFRTGETVSSEARSETQFFSDGGGDGFVGSSETRDGVTEVFDANFEVVGQKADLNSSLTFAQMAGDLGSEWSNAWAAVAEYLPTAFKPSGDYSNLKFTFDQWDNILVFSPSGDMVGRIWAWADENSQERAWRGDFEIWSHQSFTFNDLDGQNIARYEFNDQYASTNGVARDGKLENDGTNVSYGISKYTYDGSGAITGANPDVDWSLIEATYDVPTAYTDTLFGVGKTFNDVVDLISLGTNTWTSYEYDGETLISSNDEVSTRVEFFDVQESDGGWHKFLGVMQIRDGFIEVRDNSWNQVAKIVDQSAALSFAEVAAEYAGFAKAWATLEAYLPSEMAVATDDGAGTALTLVNDLKFTFDEWQIYVFDASGNMLSQVNYWADDNNNEWIDWNNGNGQEITLSGSHYNYNFHDENWNNYGHAGGNLTYITKVDGVDVTPILHEVGSNYGYRVSKEEYVAANGQGDWDALNPNVTQIDWSLVTEVELNSNSWASVDNAYREGDPWSNENEQVMFFNANQHYVGSIEMRDGFIEVRDGQWNTLVRKADLTDAGAVKSFADMITKFGPDWDTAWTKVAPYLSEAFKPGGDYTQLKFTLGEWDDVMVFSADGTLIGRINTWGDTNVQDRSWRGDYQIWSNQSFNFNDADWNNIARYEVNGNWASADGTTKGVQESSGENLSVRVSKADVPAEAWSSYQTAYATKAQALISDWADVSSISVGSETWTDYDELGAVRGTPEVSTRVEFFEEKQGGHEDFLGVMQIRDGFIEVRDNSWNTIDKSVDLGQSIDFAAAKAKYSGLAKAIKSLESYLPSEMAVATDDGAGTALTLVNDLKFTNDDWNIYVADASGDMVAIINTWTQQGEWYELGDRYTETEYNYNFQTPNYMKIAEYGERAVYVGLTGSETLDETASWMANTVTAADIGQQAWDDMKDYFTDMTKTPPLTWSDVASASLKTNIWVDAETNTNSAKFIEFMDVSGHRLGMVEDNDGIISVYDGNWDLLESYISSDVTGIPFLNGIVAAEAPEFLALFGSEMRAAFPNIDSYEFVEAANGPAFMLYNGQIEGFIYANDWINPAGDEAHFEFYMQDDQGRDIFRAGGFTNPKDTSDPVEPSGLFLSTYQHHDLMTDEEWSAITGDAKFSDLSSVSGFDWNEVVAIESRSAKEDWSKNDTPDPMDIISYNFIVEDQYGQLNHDYFKVQETGGVRAIEEFKNGYWETVGQKVVDSTQFALLSTTPYADPVNFIFTQIEVNAPGKLDYYFGDFATSIVKLNGATGTFIIEDSGSNLVATGFANTNEWTRDDGIVELNLDVHFEFVDRSEPVTVGATFTLDQYDMPATDNGHGVWIGQNYTIENYSNAEWQLLLTEHVPSNIDGLNRDEIGILHVVDQYNTNETTEPFVADHYSHLARTQLVPFVDGGRGYDYQWDYDNNYHIRVQDAVQTIKFGDKIISQEADTSNLVRINDLPDLTAFNSDLADITHESGLGFEILNYFDVYYVDDNSGNLVLTVKGTQDGVFVMRDSTDYWTANANARKGPPAKLAYDIYSVVDDQHAGWLWKSTVGFENPFAGGMAGTTYGYDTRGIEAEVLTADLLSIIDAVGQPDALGYSISQVDSFSIQRLLHKDSGGATLSDTIVVGHELDGVDKPWVARMYVDQSGFALEQKNGENLTEVMRALPNGSDMTALREGALHKWLEYWPSVADGTYATAEVLLSGLAEFSPDAQNIVNKTGYFADIFSKMSVTQFDKGMALLELGAGEQSTKLVLQDMSAAWMFEYQDTLSGFDVYDWETGEYLGWLWESTFGDNGYGVDTKIYSFELLGLPASTLPAANVQSYAAIGLPTSAAYSLDDVAVFELRRDLHVDENTNTLGDKYTIIHLNSTGATLGGVGFDLRTGEKVDIASDYGASSAGSPLSGSELATLSTHFETVFAGIIGRLPEMLSVKSSVGSICEIDPTTEYDALISEGYETSVTGLNTFKSAGAELSGVIPSIDLTSDVDHSSAVTSFNDSLDSGWNVEVIDFETSALGNFAASGYTAAANDRASNQSGDMSSEATGTLTIDDVVSVTLFNTGDEAGNGGTSGDDPGIASNTGNNADRGFNTTVGGDRYLEILAGEDLSGGALFCFDDLAAPVYGFSFNLMGVEDTKRDVMIDVHLMDGTVYRDVADKQIVNTGGYQFYGYSLDPSLAAGTSIEGFALYEPYDGEAGSARDIFAIDDLTIAYGETYENLCTIDLASEYASYISGGVDTALPAYMTSFVSARLELDGNLAGTVAEAAIAASASLLSYHDTVDAFATAVALANDHWGFVVHDFEDSAPGNFAVAGYTASTDESVMNQAGDMNTGANGTLVTKGVMSISLFNTADNGVVDDPGIASHFGNDAHSGFNMTASGSQYLEILPSQNGAGGASFCFDEINVPVYGLGFSLMGVEETKRDIAIDIHLTDGTIYREIAEAHALGNGGQQYYSYLIDDTILSGGASIEGFVLYEDRQANDVESDRDIFSVDDIALVVSDNFADLTLDEFVHLSWEILNPSGSII